jgi:HEAT repeat protein
VLRVRGGIFVLPDGQPVRGPGIDELAEDLRRRAAPQIRIHPDLEPGELAAVIEALSREPDPIEPALQYALDRAGVCNVWTTDEPLRKRGVPEKPDSAGEVSEPERVTPERSPLETEGNRSVRREAAFRTSPAAYGLGRDPRHVLPPIGMGRMRGAEELNCLMEEMESCSDVSAYPELVGRFVECAEKLLGSDGVGDVERGVVLLCSQAMGSTGLPQEILPIAGEALRRLSSHPQILGRIVVRACSGTVPASVQAAEILELLGPSALARLLEERAHPSAEVRKRVATLVANLGAGVFAPLAEELASQDTPRIMRAAEILGELKNPSAAEVLVEQLAHPDPEVRRVVAKALFRVGCDGAQRVLISALEGPAEIAELAAYCLGSATGESVVAALAPLADPENNRPEAVQREAVRSLGRIGSQRGARVLARVLEQRSLFGRRRNRELRITAAQALGRIGGREAVAALRAYADERDPAIRQACVDSLRQLRAPRR